MTQNDQQNDQNYWQNDPTSVILVNSWVWEGWSWFLLAESDRQDLLFVVTRWPEMTKQMTQMTLMTITMTQHVQQFFTTRQFMSASSSFTQIFGLAEGPRLDLVVAVVTEWHQMANQMTQMTKKMTQHVWLIWPS